MGGGMGRGGGMGGGGFGRGGGFVGGGGFGRGGGFAHGGFGGFRGGGFRGGGFRGNGFRGFGFRGFGRPFFGSSFGLGFGGLGWGGGWGGWGGYDGGYYDAYDSPYYGTPSAYGYSGGYQQPSSNVTVVYPPQQPASTVIVERARPVSHEYDEYGQEVRPSVNSGGGGSSGGSPIYLLAFKDHSISAVAAYWVTARTLHYVTMDHLEKLVPLEQVDRSLSSQLNRERNVTFSLPQ
jgi:hypothetical protein